MEKLDTHGLGFAPAGERLQRQRHTAVAPTFVRDLQCVDWLVHDASIMDTSQLSLASASMRTAASDEKLEYGLFCPDEVVSALFATKNRFDHVSDSHFRAARDSANPYETVGGSVFQNRAAVKLANLDALCGLTHIYRPDYVGTRDEREQAAASAAVAGGAFRMTFCDVCAGPGGFTEYLTWRFDGRARGYGMTLKGSMDWRVDRFCRPLEPGAFEVRMASYACRRARSAAASTRRRPRRSRTATAGPAT